MAKCNRLTSVSSRLRIVGPSVKTRQVVGSSRSRVEGGRLLTQHYWSWLHKNYAGARDNTSGFKLEQWWHERKKNKIERCAAWYVFDAANRLGVWAWHWLERKIASTETSSKKMRLCWTRANWRLFRVLEASSLVHVLDSQWLSWERLHGYRSTALDDRMSVRKIFPLAYNVWSGVNL